MEYVDGHSLMDVISKMGMSEGQIAAVCREVRDLTCASDDLTGQDCPLKQRR